MYMYHTGLSQDLHVHYTCSCTANVGSHIQIQTPLPPLLGLVLWNLLNFELPVASMATASYDSLLPATNDKPVTYIINQIPTLLKILLEYMHKEDVL